MQEMKLYAHPRYRTGKAKVTPIITSVCLVLFFFFMGTSLSAEPLKIVLDKSSFTPNEDVTLTILGPSQTHFSLSLHDQFAQEISLKEDTVLRLKRNGQYTTTLPKLSQGEYTLTASSNRHIVQIVFFVSEHAPKTQTQQPEKKDSVVEHPLEPQIQETTQEVVEILPQPLFRELTKKRLFTEKENPHFIIDVPEFNENQHVTTTLYNTENEKIQATQVELSSNQYEITLPKKREVRPGKYTMIIDVDGNTSELTFWWGVLAINTHKSIYREREDAFIGLAVLDDRGRMVCDADIVLEITDPAQGKTILSTEKEIQVSDECEVYGVTHLPDYYTTYTTGLAGEYTMKMTATTGSGVRVLDSSFFVESNPTYDVERNGPTRIYPLSPYTMKFTITPNKDYHGQIIEKVPASFDITPSQSFRIQTQGEEKLLIWENVTLLEDTTTVLFYEFDAPDLSPVFYELGPLDIGDWTEKRSWHIASDAITILNVQSYPRVGGHWVVQFTTKGKENLTIEAVDGTTWSNESESGDLTFIELACGNQTLPVQWINNKVIVEDYSCDEVGSETSKVITQGKHTLLFTFGNETAYAFNDANQDFFIQRMEITNFGADEDTLEVEIPVAATNFSHTFARLTSSMKVSGGPDSETSNQPVQDVGVTLEMINTTHIRLTRSSSSDSLDQRLAVEIIEYIGPRNGINEFIVRGRGTIAQTGAGSSATAISGISNVNNTVPFMTGIRASTTGSVADDLTATLRMTNSGNLLVNRTSAGGTTNVSFVVVEFIGSNWQIGHVTHGFSGTGDQTVNIYESAEGNQNNIDIQNWSQAFIEYSYQAQDGQVGLEDTSMRVWDAGSTTQLMMDLEAGADSVDARVIGQAHIIRNRNFTVQYLNPSEGSPDNNFNVTINTLSAMNQSSVHPSLTSTGTGTAYIRQSRNFMIVSNTLVNIRGHRTGNALTTRFAVTQWPTAPRVPPEVTNAEVNVTTPVDIHSVVKINASVIDDQQVNSVIIQMTYPNSSQENLTTTNNGDEYFNDSLNLTQLGNYTFQFFANDITGFSNNTEFAYTTNGLQELEVIDQVLPIIDAKFLNESGTVNVNSFVCLNATGIADNVEVDTILAEITDSAGIVLNVTMTDVSPCSGGANDGVYGVEVAVGAIAGTFYYNASYVNDTSNNIAANTTQQNVTVAGVDSVPPILTIDSPQNISYTTGDIDYNLTGNEPLHTVLISVNGGENMTTTSDAPNHFFNLSGDHETLSEGNHNITFYANDTSGNNNETTLFFGVDGTPPSISNEAVNLTNLNINEEIQLTATTADNISDVSELIVTIRFPNGTLENYSATEVSQNQWEYDFLAPIRGQYNWTRSFGTSIGGTNVTEPGLVFDVFDVPTIDTVTINNTDAIRGTVIRLQSHIRNSTNHDIENQNISFFYNNTFISSNFTNTTGHAIIHWSIPSDTVPGIYIINVSYQQNATAFYRAAENADETTNVSATSQITATLNDTSILQGQTVLINATLRYDNGSLIAEQPIDFSYYNITEVSIGTAITDTNGIASLVWDTRGADPRTYTLNISFDENVSIHVKEYVNNTIRPQIFSSFGTLNVTLHLPDTQTVFNISQNDTFSLNTTVACIGIPEQTCSLVNGTARSNATTTCAPNCPTNVQAENDIIILDTAVTQLTIPLQNRYDLSKTFMKVHHASADLGSSSTPPDETSLTARFVNGTAIEVERYVTNSRAAYLSYSILQADNIEVRNWSYSWSTSEENADVHIESELPSDYLSRCFVETHRNMRLNSADLNDHVEFEVRTNITNTTNIHLTRDTEGGAAANSGVQYGFVVCFLDNTQVQNGDFSIQAALGSEANADISVDPSRSFSAITWQYSANGVGTNAILANITNSSTLVFHRDNSDGSTTAVGTYYVIEFESGSNALAQHVWYNATGSGSALNYTTQEFQPVDQNRTFLNCENTMANGGGTAFTRGYWAFEINESNNGVVAAEGRDRSDNQWSEIICQVISWPNETTYETSPAMVAISATPTMPFHTIDNQPQACGLLAAGDSCQLNWTVNATGELTFWEVDVLFSSDSTTVPDNDTLNALINLSFIDEDAPRVTNAAINDSSFVEVNTIVRINATILDNVNVTNVFIEMSAPNESLSNLTTTQAGTEYFADEVLSQVGNYTFRVFASDANQNLNQSELALTINGTINITIENTPPTVDLGSPSDNLYTFNSQPFFTYNITDPTVGQTMYSTVYLFDVAPSPIGSNVSLSPVASLNISNQTNITIGDDTYQWWVNVSDGLSEVRSEVRTITIDTSAPQFVTFISPTPVNGTNTSQTQFTINVSFTESNPSGCAFLLDATTRHTSFNTTIAQNHTCFFSFFGLTDGNHTYTVSINDSAGNVVVTENRSLIVDTIRPDVINPFSNISLPTRSNHDIRLNVTVTDPSPSSGIFNVSAGNGTFVPLVTTGGNNYTFEATPNELGCTATNGPCLIGFNASDFALNENTTEFISITIDDESPLSLSYVPPTPSPFGDIISQSEFILNVTYTETNPDGCLFAVDGNNFSTSYNNTGAEGRQCSFRITSLVEGNHTFVVFVNDSAGNNAGAENRSFIVDTIRPDVSNPFANVSVPIHSSSVFRINVTISDPQPSSGLLNVTVGNETMVAMTTGGGNNYTIETTASTLGCTATNGNCTIRLNASDFALNENTTEFISITIDDIVPDVVNASINSSEFIEVLSTVRINASVTDTNLDTVLIEILHPNESFVNVTPIISGDEFYIENFNLTQIGNYSFLFFANDSAQNLNATEFALTQDGTINLTVQDTQSPTIDAKFINQTESATVNSHICINVTGISDNFQIHTIWAEVTDSAGIVTNFTLTDVSSCSGGVGDGVYGREVLVGANPGTFYYNTSYVNDSSNNVNSNTTVQSVPVTGLDTVAPQIAIDSPQNISYSTGDIDYNLTGNEPLHTVLISIDGAENMTTTNDAANHFFNLSGDHETLADGQHTAFFFANDTSGNANESNVTFTVDTTFPADLITVSPTLVNGSVTPNDWVFVNITFTELRPDTCTLTFDSSNYTMTRSGSTCFINITSLSDDLHTFVFYVNDTAKNLAGNGTFEVTVDTTPPSISIESPENISYTTGNIDYNITVSEVLSLAYVSVDGGANSSMQNDSTTHFFNLSINHSSVSDGSHSITFFVNDSVGNINTSTVFFFVDTTPPSISIESPENISYPINALDYNISVSEALDSAIVSIDGDENISLVNDSITHYFNLSINHSSLSEGQHTATFFVNDTLGNANQSSVLFIVDTISPILTIHLPQNTTYTSTTIPLNTTANENISSWWYNLNGESNTTFDPNTTITGVEGSNELYVYANDSVGNENVSHVIFTIDTISPSITVESPLNQSYANGSLDYSIIVSEPLSSAFASINAGENMSLINDSLTHYFNLSANHSTLSEGTRFITFYVNDSYGNANETTVYFTVDLTPPSITIESPINISYNTGDIDYNITVSENLHTALASIDGGTNHSLTNDSLTHYFNLSTIHPTLTEGHHEILFFVNDSVGNENTNSRFFRVDVTTPTTINTVPPTLLNNSVTGHTYVFVNVTFVESFPNNCLLAFNQSINYTMTREGNNCFFNVTNLDNATHNYTIYVNDTAGNTGANGTFFVSVDIDPPALEFIAPTLPNQSTINDDWIFINVSGDELLDSCLVYQNEIGSFENTTMNASAADHCFINRTNLDDVSVYFRVYGNDSVGNVNQTEDRVITIDAPPRNIVTVTPTLNNNSVSFDPWVFVNVTFTDGDPHTCILEVNQTVNYTMTRAGNNCFFNVTNLNDTTHNYTITVNDTIGQAGVSNRYHVTVDTSRIPGVLVNHSRVEMTSSQTSLIHHLPEAIDLNKSFLIVESTSEDVGSGDDVTGEAFMVSGAFINSTAIQFSRFGTDTRGANFSYSVIEADNIRVRSGSVTMSAGANTNETNVTVVPELPTNYNDKCFVVLNTRADDTAQTNVVDGYVQSNLTNRTQLTLHRSREESSFVATRVDYHVVCFVDNTSVQTGQVTGTTSGFTNLDTPVDPQNAFLIFNYESTGADNNGLGQVALRGRLQGSGSVAFNRSAVSTSSFSARYYVIEFDNQTNPGEVQRGTTATQSDLDEDVGISEVGVLSTFPSTWADSSGTGTAFPRPQWFSTIINPTTLNLHRARTGQSSILDWQVVTWNFPDQNPPSSITFVAPTLANNSNTTVNYFEVNITFNELNTDSCVIQVNNGTTANRTMTIDKEGMTCFYNATNEPDSIITYTVLINDTLGNLGQSLTQTLTLDAHAPLFSSDQDDSGGSVTEGTVINISVYWTDQLGLDAAIFRSNETGTFVNTSLIVFDEGANQSYANFTINTVGYAGEQICWHQYANDTLGNLNNTMENHCFSVTAAGRLAITLESPNTTLTTNILQNTTLLVNATIVCQGGPCSDVHATVRYNATTAEPDTPISTIVGATPLYINESPAIATKSCSGPLAQNDYCNITWSVNVTGEPESEWRIGVLFNSTNPAIPDNHTRNGTIHIIPCTVDVTTHFNTVSFGNTLPNTFFNPASGNALSTYNISINQGSCNTDLYIKGTHLTNTSLGSEISVSNLSVSNTTNDSGNAFNLTQDFETLKLNVSAVNNISSFYWLAVPALYAGPYTGTITIRGVEHGLGP